MKPFEKVEAHIADAVKKGARLVDRRQAQRPGRHLFRADGADRCDDRHGDHKEETFRPVASLHRFKPDAQAKAF